MNEIDYFLESTGMVDRGYEINYNSYDLYSAIDILEPKVKSVIILRYYCNFNINEISEILELSPSTVNTFTRRGLKEMKGILSEDSVC
jgi:RNA polymerase sigma-70 factor (ECF subfamily)